MVLEKPGAAMTQATGRQRGQPGYNALVAQIQDSDPTVRRRGVHDLAEHPAAAAQLLRLLATEPDNCVRAALKIALARIGGDVVVAGMLDLLRSRDPVQRKLAIDVLKQSPGRVGVHMEALLLDPDSDVRIFAINVLEALCHPKLESSLIRVIAQDAHVNVVSTALEMISDFGTEAALPALERVVARFPVYPYIAFVTAAARRRIAGAA